MPAYVVGSWTNVIHTRGSLAGFRRISSRDKWLRVHNSQEWRDYYDPRYVEDLLRFSDQYLKGVDNGWQRTPTVRLAVLDPGHTDTVDRDFPLARTAYRDLHLTATGGLSWDRQPTAAAVRYPVAAPPAADGPPPTGQATFFGPGTLVEARLQVVRRAVAGIPGAALTVRTYPGDVTADQVRPADLAQLGIPAGDKIQMAAWRGGEPAHTDFSLVCPTTGQHVQRQADLISERVHRAGFDYAGGFTVVGRHSIALCLLGFDRGDARQRTAVRELFPRLVRDAAAAGYAPYRSHVAYMDVIADRYDFNDHAQRRLQRRLKGALDPQGVLSAGKQGVW